MRGAATTDPGHRMTPASGALVLPAWAQAGDKRRAHIGRVTALLEHWAARLGCGAGEAAAMRDVGLWHDALRDAPEAELRELTGDAASPPEILHGPAAAVMLERAGEARREVVEAVRWHTLGSPAWGRVGRALYMADFLEPGRKFMVADRAFLAGHVPFDFDGVFRQVLRARLEWSLREGLELFPQAVALWNDVR
jgi:2-amino-4-hydroxy-6-hydroxymethyldihydropteridine diphosphokinase